MADPSEGQNEGQKSELGDFLRSRRERLTPKLAGLSRAAAAAHQACDAKKWPSSRAFAWTGISGWSRGATSARPVPA